MSFRIIKNFRKGDIILTKEKTFISKGIRTVLGSNYSHAILVIDTHCVIDADSKGVHARDPQRIFLANDEDVIVLRYEGLSSEQLKKITNFARKEIGKEYSKTEAYRAGLNQKYKKNNNLNNYQFCSKLVAQAYECAGINLVEKSTNCTPLCLEECSLLTKVDDISYQLISQEEKEVLENRATLMIDIINNILYAIRKHPSKPKINNIQDMVIFSIKSDENDLFVLDTLEKARYSLPLQEERLNTARLFDNIHKLRHIFPKNILKEVLESYTNMDLNHHRITIDTLKDGKKLYPNNKTINYMLNIHQDFFAHLMTSIYRAREMLNNL